MDILTIDASILEGGGQILRNALSLSCILKRPIKVFNIRAGRPKPGLAAQHLFGLNLLQEITNGNVSGNTIGSTTIEFRPGEIKSGKYFADTKTAGSVSLLLQVSLPVLLFGQYPSELELKGGTNAAMAPQIDFVTEVLRPNLEKFGVTFDFDLFKRGYYPKGGGHCLFKIPSVKKLKSIQNTEFGSLSDVFGWSFVAGVLPIKVAMEMKNGAMDVLRNICALDRISIEAYKESPDMARETSSGIILGASTTNGCVLGSSGLGDRKVSPWNTGSNAAKELLKCLENRQCTDQFVQDQLIIYMALADGESVIQSCKPTMHTLTAIHVAELMTGVKFEIVDHPQSGNYLIKCKGIGFTNRFN